MKTRGESGWRLVSCICAFAIALIVVGECVADIIVGSDGDFQLSLTDPVDVGNGSEDLVAVILKATYMPAGSSNQQWPTSFSGQIGINGTLHHEQFRGGPPLFPRVTTPTASGAANSSVDSHFLLDPRVTVSAPIEPAVNDATSAEPGDFGPDPVNIFTGFGGPLSADVGFYDAGNQPSSATLDIARLVGKRDAMFDFKFQIATSTIGLFADFEGSAPFGGVIENIAPEVTGGGIIPVALDMVNAPPLPTTAMFQFTATDDAPLDELEWTIDSFVYNGPGTNTGQDPTIDATGKLSWLADGWAGGQYVATVRATDAGDLFGTASVTFDLTVPEPASFVLFGLALIGVVGARRK